jgi:hypothetical protein
MCVPSCAVQSTEVYKVTRSGLCRHYHKYLVEYLLYAHYFHIPAKCSKLSSQLITLLLELLHLICCRMCTATTKSNVVWAMWLCDIHIYKNTLVVLIHDTQYHALSSVHCTLLRRSAELHM